MHNLELVIDMETDEVVVFINGEEKVRGEVEFLYNLLKDEDAKNNRK